MNRDRDDKLPSSVFSGSSAADDRYDERLTPSHARAVLHARFTTAGMALEPGAEWRAGGTPLILDGYDSKRRAGYAYIESRPADIARGSSPGSPGAALKADQSARILLVYQEDMPNLDVLERCIDAYFRSLRA